MSQKLCDKRESKKCLHTIGNKTIDLAHPPHPKEGFEFVKATYDKDEYQLLVPSKKPREVARLLDKDEFDRIKKQAKVITTKEKMAILEEAENERRNKEYESAQRKDQLQKAQIQHKQTGPKLNTIESEAKKKTYYLLKRAFEMRQEQEDEVKKANQFILAAKCLAIRAAQVAEKELVKKEILEEDRRLDNMMEEQRRKSLEEEELRRQKEKEKNQKFVSQMMQQIKEKEIEKLQEGERIEQEARMQNKALIYLQQEEEKKRKLKLEQQAKLREELAQANAEIARYKQIEKEEQRIGELRVQEFMRRKAEREAAYEEEQRLAKIAKEKEVARLRALQEKQQDLQAQRDEMNALRVQEEVEREWRRKEKAAAEKKRQEEENLRIARAQQIEDIRRKQALELEREKQDFYKVVQVQKALQQKDIEKEQKRKEESLKHRQEILQQVKQKELERINKRKEKFEEGLAIRKEQETREHHIKEALKSKIQKLRETNVPESVVKDIERELKITA